MEDRRISDLQKAIGKLAEKAQAEQIKKQQEERLRILIELSTASFDKAIAYVNVIILAGYAGMFTVWSLTKEHLSTEGNASVALLLSVSLAVFCGWEVFKMILYSRKHTEYAQLIQKKRNPEDFF